VRKRGIVVWDEKLNVSEKSNTASVASVFYRLLLAMSPASIILSTTTTAMSNLRNVKREIAKG